MTLYSQYQPPSPHYPWLNSVTSLGVFLCYHLTLDWAFLLTQHRNFCITTTVHLSPFQHPHTKISLYQRKFILVNLLHEGFSPVLPSHNHTHWIKFGIYKRNNINIIFCYVLWVFSSTMLNYNNWINKPGKHDAEMKNSNTLHTHTPTETIFILVMIMLRRWCDDDHNACSWLPPMLLLMLPIKFEGKFVLCLKNFPTYENRRRKFLWKYIFSYSSSSCLPYMRYNVRAAQTYCKEINKTWKKMWMGAGC